MKDKISLAGDLGSGKSTVAKILIRELGAEKYATGEAMRKFAEQLGMTVGEFNVYMETHPEYDKLIDEGLMALSEDERFLIIDSRMAWHFTKGTFKIYLSTDIETSSLRIMSANRPGEHDATLEETMKNTRLRRESEKKRYSELYGVDIKDLTNYTLVVDTTVAGPEEIAELIITSFGKWQNDRLGKWCFISPERLNYPDDAPDELKLMEYSSMLEEGGQLPEITVFEIDGEFYLKDGLEAALAYSLNKRLFIPTTLTRGTADGKKYVRMKNSL